MERVKEPMYYIFMETFRKSYPLVSTGASHSPTPLLQHPTPTPSMVEGKDTMCPIFFGNLKQNPVHWWVRDSPPTPTHPQT